MTYTFIILITTMINQIPASDGTEDLKARLKELWSSADYYRNHMKTQTKGMNQWNNTLNTIYTNLSYKNKLTILKDKDGKVIDVKSESEPESVNNYFKINLQKLLFERKKATLPGAQDGDRIKIIDNQIYNLILKKDMWLRSYAYSLGVYIKEIENMGA